VGGGNISSLGDKKKAGCYLGGIFWENIPQVRHVLREKKEEVEMTIFKPYVLACCQ